MLGVLTNGHANARGLLGSLSRHAAETAPLGAAAAAVI